MNIKFDNQNENYPIVLIPDNIFSRLHTEIDESVVATELNISKPQKATLRKPEVPSKYIYQQIKKIETKSTEHTGCVFLVFFASIVLSFFVADTFLDGLKFILYGTLGYLAFFSFMLLLNGEFLIKFKTRTDSIKVNRSPEELRILELEYKEKLKKYNLKLETNELTYKVELESYFSKIEGNKNKIQKKLYLENLEPIVVASRGSLSLKRGVAELKFLEKLNLELQGLIFVDMVPYLGLSGNRKIYNPDFTLICEKTNLHIDIEIDEPYTLVERQPIHYIGSSDNRRNEFFLDNNWCIIRFSERQILQSTTECIETIKSVYNNLIEKNSYYLTKLQIEERWTYEKSLIMQNNKYREKLF